jgi:hypothetical protein
MVMVRHGPVLSHQFGLRYEMRDMKDFLYIVGVRSMESFMINALLRQGTSRK